MSRNYIRFVTRLKDAETSKDLGIFQAFGRLEDKDKLEGWAQERGNAICNWFDQNLKAPKMKGAHWRAVFWFRADQQEMVKMLWELVAILEEHGVIVALNSTDDPGTIVYRDSFQVAAVPFRRKSQAKK